MSLLLALISGGAPAGVGVSASLVDAADTIAVNVSPVGAVSAALVDPSDTIAVNLTVSSGVSASLTDPSDTLAVAVTVSSGVSAALVDPTDTIAATVTPVAATTDVSASLVDPSDTLAVSVTVSSDVSASLVDPTDVISVQIDSAVGASNVSAALVDPTDTLSAAVGVSSDVSALLVDPADTLDSLVSPVGGAVDVSAFLVDADDTLSIQVDSGAAQVAGGYDDDKPKKKRYFVEKDGKLLVYSTPTGAIGSLNETGLNSTRPVDKHIPAKKQKKKQVLIEIDTVQPEEVIDLSAVQEWAKVAGQIEAYNQAYNSARFEYLIALFEQMRDEEDIEILLLG